MDSYTGILPSVLPAPQSVLLTLSVLPAPRKCPTNPPGGERVMKTSMSFGFQRKSVKNIHVFFVLSENL